MILIFKIRALPLIALGKAMLKVEEEPGDMAASLEPGSLDAV